MVSITRNRERPQALNPVDPENEDDFVLATKWRVKVRFDDPEVVYDTLSTKSCSRSL